MRLFRKTVAKAEKGKRKNGKDATATEETQYEYVRKEFGFDYVPPSQYVPSHSLSEDEDDDDDEAGGNVDDDLETVELQYQGAAPVKIIQPRSDLSGSVRLEDETNHVVPKKKKDNNKIKPVNPHRHVKKIYRPTRNTPLIPEEEEMDDLEEEAAIYYEDAEVEEREFTPERHHHHRTTRPSSGHRVPRNPPPKATRRTTATPEDVFRPKRTDRPGKHEHPVGDQREEHDDRQARRSQRRYLREDEVEDLDDLGIGRVHTAFSYSSDDSAESLVEEQSRGSRYSAEQNKQQPRGHRSTTHHLHHPRQPSKHCRTVERDSGDDRGFVVRSTSWRKTRKGWKEYEGDERTSRDERRSDLEKYERPRYDRKKGTSQRESRDEISVDYRKDVYDVDVNELREPSRPPSSGHREVAYRSSGPDIVQKSHDARGKDWDSKELFSRRRNHLDASSYYAAPSGKVAADYDTSLQIEEPRVTSRHKRSKGFLGRIRDSVRGSPSKKERRREKSRGGAVCAAAERRGDRVMKPSALFEQVPPSMRSDVSFDNRSGSNFHRREPDVPSTMPRTKRVSYPPRKSYEYDSNPAYDGYSEGGNENEEGYNSRRRSGHHRRHHRERPQDYDNNEYYEASRRMHEEEEYWESPAMKVTREKRATERRQSSYPGLPFDTARNETPALRHNPDRRRSYAREYVKNHHSNNDRRNYAATDVPERYGSERELRYANLNSPKLIHEHPTISNSAQPTNGKGIRMGCY